MKPTNQSALLSNSQTKGEHDDRPAHELARSVDCRFGAVRTRLRSRAGRADTAPRPHARGHARALPTLASSRRGRWRWSGSPRSSTLSSQLGTRTPRMPALSLLGRARAGCPRLPLGPRRVFLGNEKPPLYGGFSCAPGRIRTCDPRIRSPLLCPLSYRRAQKDGTTGATLLLARWP
jgi:hypothetical protein